MTGVQTCALPICETILKAIETIKTELRVRLDEFVKDGKLVEAQRLEQRTRFDLEMLNELGFCKGIENYSRHLSGAAPGEAPPTLVDYLPNDALMFLDESHVLIGQLNAMYNGDKSCKACGMSIGPVQSLVNQDYCPSCSRRKKYSLVKGRMA